MKYQFGPFWLIFGLMTSPRGVQTSKFWDSVVVITTGQLHWTNPERRFCGSSNSASGVSEIHDGEDLWQWSLLEIRLNAFRRSTITQKQFIINSSPSPSVVSKTNNSPRVSLYYWLSFLYHHYYIKYKFESFMTPFWVNDFTTRVKTAIFWESNLRNKLLNSKFHQILISIFVSPSIHDIQSWILFTQFGDNDVTKETNIPEFWKIN